jgi:hypothetical protein
MKHVQCGCLGNLVRYQNADYTGQQNLTFFGTRRKISVPNRTFNAEFKYVSSFSPSPTFFCHSQVKCEKMCIFTYFTGQQKLTFFGTRRKISVPNRTFNAEFKYVSIFSPSLTVCL